MGRRGQFWVMMGIAALVALPCAVVRAQTAAPAACARADFENVVAAAAEALRVITQQNSPIFQSKLRSLKEKRGWSHDQFMTEGARYVRDDKITAFDNTSGDLLARINNAGGDTGAAQSNCAQLQDLKANMAALVDIQTAKWTYMFANIDAELAR